MPKGKDRERESRVDLTVKGIFRTVGFYRYNYFIDNREEVDTIRSQIFLLRLRLRETSKIDVQFLNRKKYQLETRYSFSIIHLYRFGSTHFQLFSLNYHCASIDVPEGASITVSYTERIICNIFSDVLSIDRRKVSFLCSTRYQLPAFLITVGAPCRMLFVFIETLSFPLYQNDRACCKEALRWT